MRFGAHRLKSTSGLEAPDFELSVFSAAACAFAKLDKAIREKTFPSRKAASQIARSIPPATSKHRSTKIDAVFRVFKGYLLITNESYRASRNFLEGSQRQGEANQTAKALQLAKMTVVIIIRR